MRKTITVNWLNKINACSDAVEAFKYQKETDSIKVLKGAMKIDRFDWANWLIARLMNRKQKLAYSIFAAESVIDIFEKKYPDDKRPRNAIEAAKKVLKSDTKKNRAAAYSAASSAAYSASSAAYSAAYSADSAYYADSAADSASSAAYSAAYSADSASSARKKLQKKIINYGIKLLAQTILQ